jgi:hypothetical protein
MMFAAIKINMTILPHSTLEQRIAQRIQERRDQGHGEHAEALRRQFWAILGQFYRGVV